MSRLLSEKRIISVNTASVAANTFDDGACVIDATNNAIKISNGTAWTELAIGTETAVTYEALDASGDIDTNLSSATANTVPSSAAVKSYVDSQAFPGITGALTYNGSQAIGTTRAHEIGVIVANCTLTVDHVMGAGLVMEVYNYTTGDFTISASSGSILDLQASRSDTAIIIRAGQGIKFIAGTGTVNAYRFL